MVSDIVMLVIVLVEVVVVLVLFWNIESRKIVVLKFLCSMVKVVYLCGILRFLVVICWVSGIVFIDECDMKVSLMVGYVLVKNCRGFSFVMFVSRVG